MAYRSPYPDISIPDVALPAFMLEAARKHGERPAIIDGLTGRTLTYSELAERIRRAAAGLTSRGLRKGDVLAIYSPNVPEYAVAFYGAALAGATVTTVSALYNAGELIHHLRDAGVSWLLTSPESVDVARRASANAGVQHVYAFGDVPGTPPFESLYDADPVPPAVEFDPREDVVALPYSSATTSLPKGVMLTHRNLVASVLQTQPFDRMTPDEVAISVLPLHHIYGLSAVMNRCLHAGAALVVLPRFDFQQFLETMEKYAVTTAYLVPPIVRMMSKHALVDSYDLSNLRWVLSAAAVLPETIARAFASRLRCTIMQAYGMTETSPATHYSARDAVRVASSGVVVPNTECRIVDVASKRDVNAGVMGEIWVRGPQVMKGYLNSRDVTRRVIDRDGWLHTGDIGYADADGYLYVVDRTKDLVKFRGLQYRDDELLLATVEDLMSRRQAAERVRYQALLLDSVRESVVGTDLDRRVTFWNKGAEALFGYSAEEAIGISVDRLIVPESTDVRCQREEEQAHLSTHEQWQGQALRRRKNGSELWTDIVISSVRDPDGAVAGFIAIHRDITDIKNSEEMLRDSNERLQNLASRLIDIREHERAALARELHDELGQALTRLKMDLCVLTDRLPKKLRTTRVASMVPLVDRLVSTVQHLSARLRPAILDDLGLEAAIEWQAQEFQEWNGARCDVHLHVGPMPPDRDRDIAIFRILQEALTNVARHAHATTVSLTSRSDEEQFVLDIADDGVGIPAGEVASPRSLGLIGMRERARAVGGDVEITPANGHGTIIRLRVPVHRATDGRGHDSPGHR